ncbi:MAG: alpha/beta fold hydrolase [Acidobacteriales bacterium]|nr:alpha/beta fold hydrolase [Terriglobales bacterium]
MRYLHAGSGRAHVLVHGLLGYSFSWRDVIPALARLGSVYAPDLPGSGFSENPPRLAHDLTATAKRLLAFLDAVAVNQCDLVGTSHGGAVAMMSASLAPERVRRLVLVAPVNPWSAHGRRLSRVLTFPPVYAAFERLAPLCTIAHGPMLRRLYGDPRRVRAGALEAYSAPYRRENAFAAHRGILKSWSQDLELLREALPRIADIPTLIVWGTRDKAVAPASAEELAHCFHDARVMMMEGAGHMPYEEMPTEFNRVLLEFLQS